MRADELRCYQEYGLKMKISTHIDILIAVVQWLIFPDMILGCTPVQADKGHPRRMSPTYMYAMPAELKGVLAGAELGYDDREMQKMRLPYCPKAIPLVVDIRQPFLAAPN